ncbi:MAG: hypothetical protein GWN58_35375, partial [Anaerolineae bacterium]|nr:hypothetical protein [Anaerolineae bacterium]
CPMTQLTVADIIHAWRGLDDDPADEMEVMLSREFKLITSLLQLLAQGQPVSAAQLAERVEMPVAQIQAIFDRFAARGGEFDQGGNLVGAALTLNPTPHHIRVNGRELYAWCALDTIFLPGLLGEMAEVESTDPITGETIRLTIAPDGVRDYSPIGAVLSIAVPGVSCSREQTGPQSDACSQMHFFRARETADTWLKDHPGLAIFTVEEAWQLAHEGWLARKGRFDAGEAVRCCAC